MRDLGPTAPFYDASLIGRKVLVTYNGQHPFYERFVLENRDNRSVISAVDFLVYSLATAELRAAQRAGKPLSVALDPWLCLGEPR